MDAEPEKHNFLRISENSLFPELFVTTKVLKGLGQDFLGIFWRCVRSNGDKINIHLILLGCIIPKKDCILPYGPNALSNI